VKPDFTVVFAVRRRSAANDSPDITDLFDLALCVSLRKHLVAASVDQEQVLTTGEQWKQAMIAKGWK